VDARLPADAVYFGEISLSGAVRPVVQTAARLKEAQKLGFARAILPETARPEATGEAGLSLKTVSSLASLVADIAGGPRDAGRRERKRFRQQDGGRRCLVQLYSGRKDTAPGGRHRAVRPIMAGAMNKIAGTVPGG